MKFRLFLDLIAFLLHSVNLFCHSRAKGWWKTYLLKIIIENQKWLLLTTELLEISQHAAAFDLEMQTQDCVGVREKYIMSWLTSTHSCSYVLDAHSVFVWKSIFLGACLLKTQIIALQDGDMLWDQTGYLHMAYRKQKYIHVSIWLFIITDCDIECVN